MKYMKYLIITVKAALSSVCVHLAWCGSIMLPLMNIKDNGIIEYELSNLIIVSISIL